MLERVFLDLPGDLGRRGQSLRMIGEQRGHLLLALEVLLPRIAHTVRIVQIAARIEADQPVVGRRVVGHDEVHEQIYFTPYSAASCNSAAFTFF